MSIGHRLPRSIQVAIAVYVSGRNIFQVAADWDCELSDDEDQARLAEN